MIAARRARLHPARGSWVLGQLKGRKMVLEIRMEISIQPRKDADSREQEAPSRTEEGLQQPCDAEESSFQLEPEVSEVKEGGFVAAQLDHARTWLSARIRKTFRILKGRSARLAGSLPERMRRAALKWPSIILQLGQGLF